MFYVEGIVRLKLEEVELCIKNSNGLIWLDCKVYKRDKLRRRLEKWVGIISCRSWNF